jgi:hypothetical protein
MVEGAWELKFLDAKTSALKSYIRHNCPEDHGAPSYWYGLTKIDDPCKHCREYPNADIMTVWKLHNWDYIQGGISH